MDTVLEKKKEYFVELELPTGKYKSLWYEDLRMWMINHKIDKVHVYANQVVDWDITKMRSFFHGVVLPAYVKAFNDSQDNPGSLIFTRNFVKDFLKAKFLGFVENAVYNLWKTPLNLNHRPSDIRDWAALYTCLNELKNPPEIVHTETLSAERYWKFLTDCERYYFALFHDMYDIRQKPKAPEGYRKQDE